LLLDNPITLLIKNQSKGNSVNSKEDIKDSRCAVCADNPATCINGIPIPLAVDYDWVEELIRTGTTRANAFLSIPTCGICHDQISNYVMEKGDGIDVGYCFRAYYECDHPFHDPDSGVEGEVKGSVGGGWTMISCPNPLCGKLLPGELCDDDPRSQRAGVLVFEEMLPRKFRTSVS
jgi:hypothetical protein